MRLKIFILSTMLLTLISGVLFYKSLTQIGPTRNILKLDFEELRSIDYQLSNTAFYLRKTLSAETSELREQAIRVKELMDLIDDINKTSPALQTSVATIKAHFDKRQQQVVSFESALKELRQSISALLPAYNSIEKRNLKYTLDKKDFYRECILDSYMYISFSHRENETRLLEDLKILNQIINYSVTPIPELVKYSRHLETIHLKVKELEDILRDFRDDDISSEMKVIATFYQENIQAQSEQNENLLTFMFVAIGIYLLFMVFILKKN